MRGRAVSVDLQIGNKFIERLKSGAAFYKLLLSAGKTAKISFR